MSFTIHTHNSFNGSQVHPGMQAGPVQSPGVQYFMYPPVTTPQPSYPYPTSSASSSQYPHPQQPPTAHMPASSSYQPPATGFMYPMFVPPPPPAPQAGQTLFQQLQAQYSSNGASHSSSSSSSSLSPSPSSQRIPPMLAYDCSQAVGMVMQLKPVVALINMSLITYAKGLFLEDTLLLLAIKKTHSIIYGSVQGAHQLFHIELSDLDKLER